MKDCNVLSKGSFSTFRFNEFVSVKQYLLIRENGKKYLLLRLVNDAKANVTSIKLCVEQIDVAGDVISHDYVNIENVNGKAGATFVLDEKIPLKDACIEVAINLVGASYGEYKYTIKSNELVIKYEEEKKEEKDYSGLINGKNTVVTKDRFFAIPKILPFIAIILIALSTVLAYFQMNIITMQSERFLWSDVYYEFVDPDRDPEAGVIAVANAGITGNIHIPEEIEGYKVIGIADGAFQNSDTIFNVTIEAPIVIPNGAFFQCSNLRSVELRGPAVVSVGAFSYCNNLRSFKAHNLQTIEERAFLSCFMLNDITITADEEYSLTIKEKAFASCVSLENIVIDQYVENMEEATYFPSGENLKKLHLQNLSARTIASLFEASSNFSKLETIIIDDIPAIPNSFAYGCSALKQVSIKGVTNTILGDASFYNCASLEKLNISGADGNVFLFTVIGDNALQNTQINNFDLSRAAVIGNYAFAYNTKLTSVNVSADSLLEKIGEGAFSGCAGLKSFEISNITMEIGDYAFNNCSSLKAFNINELSILQKIGNHAFEGCYNLQEFDAPYYLQSIGDYAFSGCAMLSDFNFSIELESIGNQAFKGCEKFSSINLHENVVSIGAGAFADCVNIEQATIPFVGYSLTQNNYLASIFNIHGFNDYTAVPNSLRSVTVLNGNIGNAAFSNLSQLLEIKIPNDARKIGEQAFYGCENLREIYIPANVQNIGDEAFLNCYRLFEVRNASSLPIILGDASFGSVAKYAIVVYGEFDEPIEKRYANDFEISKGTNGWVITNYVGTSSDWTTPVAFIGESALIVREYSIPAYLFKGCEQVKTLAVSAAAKSIGEFAFEGCYNLEKVAFAKNCLIEQIEQFVFCNCNRLKTIDLSENIKKLDDNAFANTAITSITLPESLEEIGEYVFSYSSLEQLTIPNSVVKIGYEALGGCYRLKTLTIPFIGNTFEDVSTLSYIMGYRGNAFIKEINITRPQNVCDYAFNGFYTLQKVTLAYGVQTIGVSSFENCYELNQLVLPKTITSIGANAFINCYSLDVELPSSIQEIGEYAFANTAIRNVKLSKNLTSLGDGAFSGCSALVNVDLSACKNLTSIPYECFYDSSVSQVSLYGSSIENIDDKAFENCRKLSKLKLGVATKNIGTRAFYYCLMLDGVTFPQNLISIGDEAFAYSDISSLILQNQIQQIGDYAFYSGNSLATVDMNCNQLTYIGNYAFGRCAKLKEATLNIANVNSIGNYLFADCDSIDKVTINADYVEKMIGTFYNCKNLTQFNLDIPNLKEIGESTYYNCLGITNFTVQSTVTAIGYSAFENCSNLKWIKLSNNLNRINTGAFDGCEKLYEVFNPSSLDIQRGYTTYGKIAYNAVVVHDSLNDIFIQTETVTIVDEENAELTGEFTFKFAPDVCCLFEYSGNIQNLKFPTVILGGTEYSGYYIRRNVFNQDPFLTTIDTGVVEEICSYAFFNCTKLTKVTINSYIGQNKVHSTAFDSCANLWEVHDLNANYDINAGSNVCGNVAFYALAINTSIQYVQGQSYKLMKINDVWFLYYIEQNSGKVVLPESFIVDDVEVNNYVLFAHPKMQAMGVFASLSGYYNEYVVVPKSVIAIMSGAFNKYDCPKIYFKGSQEEWQAIDCEQKGINPYFYAQCIHYEFGDYMLWTYDQSGEPTINQTSFDDQGKCATCDRRIITSSTLGELVTLNNVDNAFSISNDEKIFCVVDRGYGEFDVNLSIKANADIKISFKIVGQGGANETVVISQNNQVKEEIASSFEKDLEFDLKLGDVLTINFARDEFYGQTCSVSIEEIVIVEAIEDPIEDPIEDSIEGTEGE